jgi:hypothetical protein
MYSIIFYLYKSHFRIWFFFLTPTLQNEFQLSKSLSHFVTLSRCWITLPLACDFCKLIFNKLNYLLCPLNPDECSSLWDVEIKTLCSRVQLTHPVSTTVAVHLERRWRTSGLLYMPPFNNLPPHSPSMRLPSPKPSFHTLAQLNSTNTHPLALSWALFHSAL